MNKKIVVLLLLVQTLVIGGLIYDRNLETPALSKGVPESKDTLSEAIPEITLSPAMEAAGGIRVMPLSSAGSGLADSVWGTVLSAAPLAESRLKIERAQLELAEATQLDERAHAEADRLEAVFKEGGNVARKLVDQARRDEVQLAQRLGAARRFLESTREEIRALYGDPVLKALSDPEGGVLAPVLKGEAELALIAESPLRQGRVVLAEDPSKETEARYIATAPQVELGTRRASSYWLLSSPDFRAGLKVRLLMPTRSNAGLAAIPESAVVWQSGSSWVYLLEEEHRYRRVRVVLGDPEARGWAVKSGVKVSDRVVVEGAELLLSQESKAQIRNENGD